MRELAIATDTLTEVYSGREVVKGCQLSVRRGQVYLLLGKNGAGKTTLFKLLLGLCRPTTGTAAILGMDSVKDRTNILRQTGHLLAPPVFYEHLSARANLMIHLTYTDLGDQGVEPVLRQVGLSEVGEQPVDTFSLGMRGRPALARALVHRPQVLLLDEPTVGLDPVAIRELWVLLRRLADQEGVTVLLSSHMLSEIRQVADRIGIMFQGRLLLQEDTSTLCRDHPQDLEEMLLGALEGGIPCE